MNKNKTDELPEGWIWTNLGEVVDDPKRDLVDGPFGSNLKADEYTDKGIPVFKIQNIKANKFVDKKINFVTEEKAKSLSRHSFIAGDLIITKLGDPLGLCCRAPVKYKFGIIVADLMRLRPSNRVVDDQFLIYAINSRVIQNQFKEITKGTTRPRVNLTIVREIKIPLPPIPEQHSIVSKIEQLFSELDKGIESLETAQQQLKVYRQSVLKWAFEGKLTEQWRQNQDLPDAQELLEKIQKEREEKAKASGKKLKAVPPLTKDELAALSELPEGWGWVNIEIIVDMDKYSLKAGPFGSSLKKEFYVEKGYKIYGQEQVIAGNSLNGDYYISKEKFEELISNKIQPHDILISLVGTVGKVLILPEHCEPGIINPRLIKVTLNRNYYNSLFFKYYFESSFLKSLYSSKAQGTTMDVLNLGIIKALPFPICSIPEQHQIVQEIECRLSECDKMEATIAASLQQAEALRQSILMKAFEGRLLNERELEAVRQDPTWEPAEKLLERIRAEKAVLHSGKKGQKSKA